MWWLAMLRVGQHWRRREVQQAPHRCVVVGCGGGAQGLIRVRLGCCVLSMLIVRMRLCLVWCLPATLPAHVPSPHPCLHACLPVCLCLPPSPPSRRRVQAMMQRRRPPLTPNSWQRACGRMAFSCSSRHQQPNQAGVAAPQAAGVGDAVVVLRVAGAAAAVVGEAVGSRGRAVDVKLCTVSVHHQLLEVCTLAVGRRIALSHCCFQLSRSTRLL